LRHPRIGWPIERVPVIVEVVHPRKLTALEWVVLRVVDAFGEDVPGLDEVAEELGIADPVFLLDTVRDVVRLRALAPRDGGQTWISLSDLAFTATGRELFRKGQIEAEPAEHGLDLYFDALTDEPRSEAKGLQSWTDAPFPFGHAAPEARLAVGLDRAREIIRQLHSDLLRGDGEVRSIRPRDDAWSRVEWAPVDVEVRLTNHGELIPVGQGLTSAAQEMLQDAEPDTELAPRHGTTASWTESSGIRRGSNLTYDAWSALTVRTLPDGTADAEVARMLQGAPAELLLHVGWYERPGVAARVDELVRAGSRIAVLGHPETTVARFQERPKPGLLVFVACDTPLPAAIVVDGRVGLVLDDVALRMADKPVTIELVGILTSQACEQIRQQLLQAVASALRPNSGRHSALRPTLAPVDDVDALASNILGDAELHRGLARLGLLRRSEDLASCMARACELAPGPERVVALSRLALVAMRLVPAIGEVDAHAAATSAWISLVQQLPAHRELVAALTRIAPPGCAPDILVQAALPSTHDVQAHGLVEATQSLLDVRAAVDARWGPGTCAGVDAFVRSRDALVRYDGRHNVPARLAAARKLLVRTELQAWTQGEIDTLPTPSTPQELEAWVEDAKQLDSEAPGHVPRLAADHVARLLGQHPTSTALLLGVAGRLLPADTLLAVLLPEGAPLRDVGPAVRALAAAGIALDAAALRRVVEQRLPAPTVLPSVAASEGVLAELVQLARDSTQTTPLVRAWVAQCAAAIPPPETPPAIAWWLSELAGLRSLLDDAPARAARQIERFSGPLRAARDRADGSWAEVQGAWRELGLPESALQDLLADRTVRPLANPSDGGSKNKKKGKKR
jgi:hypothetical protein